MLCPYSTIANIINKAGGMAHYVLKATVNRDADFLSPRVGKFMLGLRVSTHQCGTEAMLKRSD